MAVLVEWYKLKTRHVLIIQCLILCNATIELMAQPENCQEPLGMESGTIRDDQITVSSIWNTRWPAHVPLQFRPDSARLHGNDAWVSGSGTRDSKPWIQVNFERTRWVTGVATQGYHGDYFGGDLWSTAYYIQYANIGTEWQTIQNNQTFPCNFDGNTTVRNHFDRPIRLRHIRIYVTMVTEIGRPAVLRFELYGCGFKASDLTTISPDEGNLKDFRIVGVAVGSLFILLVGVVELIRCRKRVCKRDKADARQHLSAEDTKMTKMQEKSEKYAPNPDNYEP